MTDRIKKPEPERTHSFDGIYGLSQISKIPQLEKLDAQYIFEMQVVAAVLPFRVNAYVVNNLINWENVPDDPVFRIMFPQKEMLTPSAFDRVAAAMIAGATPVEIKRIVSTIHDELNPHPGDQLWLNGGSSNDRKIEGMQHKYDETVLYFPSEGQTCHAYCTFCFRWAQFVQAPPLRMAMSGSAILMEYLRCRPNVSDVLITGGDPFIMKARRLRSLVEPLMASDLSHIANVRFGTKALTFRPHRFLTDPDADELLCLLKDLVKSGKHVAIMVHFNHWQEMEQPLAREAIKSIQATGAVLRSQSPILRNVNDDPAIWARMWCEQVRVGIIPYYMFVARDTGAQSHFDLPLVRAWEVYSEAIRQVSGLARTARGPTMSTSPGKIEFVGPVKIHGEKVFALRFLQARDPSWCNRPFFATADENASWFGDLKPAFGEDRFFFEDAFEAIRDQHRVVHQE